MAQAIEAQDFDAHSDADDSGYDEASLSSASVTSSIYNYEQEHGRTYHAFHAGKYPLPNDEGEQERLDIHYHSLRLTIEDKLFHAPLPAPTAILDVGTGTGIWAMDVADEFPGAEVMGIDLSPIQPSYVPPNLRFEICDADDPWGLPGRFDLVHTRCMNGVSFKSWPNFYEQAFESLRPGGWVENQEFDLHRRSDDDSIPPDSKVREWEYHWNRGAEIAGFTGGCDPQSMSQQMRTAGFRNVVIKEYKVPIGPWPKDKRLREAGMYGLIALLEGLHGLSIRVFTRFLGWTTEELEVLLWEVRTELKKKSVHSYWPV